MTEGGRAGESSSGDVPLTAVSIVGSFPHVFLVRRSGIEPAGLVHTLDGCVCATVFQALLVGIGDFVIRRLGIFFRWAGFIILVAKTDICSSV